MLINTRCGGSYEQDSRYRNWTLFMKVWEGDSNLKKSILVTGGAGFIGSNLCESLLERGFYVINIDNMNDFYDPDIKKINIDETKAFLLKKGIDNRSYKFLEGDIRDKEFLRTVFSSYNIDSIIHLAAYAGVRPSIENPGLYMDVNVNGTVNLLELAKVHGINKFVFASSSSVYGNNTKVPFSEQDPVDNPISPYAASKKAGELICHTYHHLYGMNIACLRFFTVFGPRQRPDLAIHKFTKLMFEEKEIPFYGDGSTERDYTYITDIIDGIIKSMKWLEGNEKVYGIFNLGESNTISLKRMVNVLEEVTEKKAKLKLLPNQPGDVKRTNADILKAKEILGYNPNVNFEDGIRLFIEWYKKRRGNTNDK